MRLAYFVASVTVAGMPVFAEPALSLRLPLSEDTSIVSVEYDCPDSGTVDVSYINAGENSLAVLSIDDVERVFVNVVSASGARYVSAEYEWWSKGDTATFTNLINDESGQTCNS